MGHPFESAISRQSFFLIRAFYSQGIGLLSTVIIFYGKECCTIRVSLSKAWPVIGKECCKVSLEEAWPVRENMKLGMDI